jgi:predicted nucleotidyltransferase
MKLSEILDPKLSYHETLNKKLWKADKLDPKVKTKLMEIARKFVSTLELSDAVIEDYVITGSNCNYNYTKQSDLDIHILVSKDKLKDCKTCKVESEDCLQAKKSLWNDRHEITIYGIPVEVYVTTESEKLVAGAGTYSLLKDEWISKPKKTKVKADAVQVSAKAEEIANEIDQLIDAKSNDEDQIKELTDKISRMRSAGLQDSGEFSIENLTFKALRNNGYIDKIRQYAVKAQDDVLSLKGKP